MKTTLKNVAIVVVALAMVLVVLSAIDKASDIVSEEVKFNAQNGEGYYREVTYKDGGFRQYDTQTGDLIGLSYDSDQDKLPSME